MLKSKYRPIPSPTYMSEEQMGQQSHMSPSSPLPHTPPRPSRLRECTTAEYEDARSPHTPRTAQYLSDLRHTRPARPSGARPPPSSKFNALRRTETDVVDAKTKHDDRPALPTSNSMPVMSTAPKLNHRRTDSDLSRRSMCSATSPFAGRPLARPPSATPTETIPEEEDPTKVRRRSSMYLENGRRWMEHQEAKSLRQALEDMDLEEDQNIHSAAQDEAAELVWKHQNPDAANALSAFANPDLKDYRSHLRKGSYQRGHSQDTASSGQRSSSDSSQGSNPGQLNSISKRSSTFEKTRKVSPPNGVVSNPKRRESSGKSYDHLADAVAKDIAQRRSSSGSNRILSGEKKLYMHPNDKIWEDPSEEEDSPTEMLINAVKEEAEEAQTQSAAAAAVPPPQQAVPSHVRKNPFARVRAQYERMERSNSAPALPTAAGGSAGRHDRVEIQRNPPSQSRNPWYMSNEPLPPTPPSAPVHEPDEVAPKTTPATTPTKEGREIRSDDIRAATSKSRKDYSSSLPRPTVVSDKPGRPIVSFQKDWKPKEIVMEEQQSSCPERPKPAKSATFPYMPPQASSSRPPAPQINIQDTGTPPIPMISLPDDPPIPSISLPEVPTQARGGAPAIPSINVDAPAINVSGPDDDPRPSSKGKTFQRPLPQPRPLPRHAATAPVSNGKSTPHYTPSIRQSGALCAHCALPIAGRILSAAGQRFHPGCFVCHECNTNLEHVAFYPEPEKQRGERVERIHARQAGIEVLLPEGMSDEEAMRNDGDPTLRFYCHLDFHELFSPRCKSCKTPIEGEVIVACGAEWHVGHFFCAQCGDPFDSTMPFVEKDGYAWCVGCHTNRYSSKCRKCKKPVTDVVVKALGADWHSECFVCMECNGEFDDGRYFLRGESSDPVCVKCEERRLKA